MNATGLLHVLLSQICMRLAGKCGNHSDDPEFCLNNKNEILEFKSSIRFCINGIPFCI